MTHKNILQADATTNEAGIIVIIIVTVTSVSIIVN
jgi:hypothetical protein